MAELDKSPDFGIESTTSVDQSGVGDANLLEGLYAETSTADPDKLTPNEPETAPAAPANKKEEEEVEISDEVASDPDLLADFLTSDENEEGEEAIPATAAQETAEQEEEQEETGGEEEEEEAPTGNIAFDSLASELAELGVFSKLEGEEDGITITSGEEFLQRFKDEQQRGANEIVGNFIGQFGQEHQDAFQAIYVKGVNPRDYFTQTAAIEDYSKLDLTVEGNQEKVVKRMLEDQGFEGEDVTAEIKKLKDYGDLEDVSKRHHKVLIKRDKQALKQQEEEAAQINQAKQVQKDEYISNVRDVLTEKLKAKEFDGIPLNVQTANELQDFLLVDKWKTESGETLTDFDRSILELKRPENHANKVKIALLLKLLEKDPTLSTIQKRGVSTKSSQLFKDVARQQTTSKRKKASNKQPASSWFK